MKSYDVFVVGAGQAGLAVGYFLKKQGFSFLLLEKGNQVGDVWRERYDSLILFTPRFYSSLPGLALEGDPNGYATKDEIANYLDSYANYFEFPIQFQTEVRKLTKSVNGFCLQTNQGEYMANNVIVTTGPFQKPFIPEMAKSLADDIVQIHTAHYRNRSQLQEGPVLVVGAGNSGAQIAVELANEHELTLSIGHKIKFMPVQLMKKSIFWWFGKLGIYQADLHSTLGSWLIRQPDPIFGYELKKLLQKGSVKLKPRTAVIESQVISFADHTTIRVKNVVWATGFYPNYRWIDIPHVCDDKGKPIHQRGISPVSGLYFVGMPWQHSRGSALIGGVGRDADFVVNSIK